MPNACFTLGFKLGESSSASQSYASSATSLLGFLVLAAVCGRYPLVFSGRVDVEVVILEFIEFCDLT